MNVFKRKWSSLKYILGRVEELCNERDDLIDQIEELENRIEELKVHQETVRERTEELERDQKTLVLDWMDEAAVDFEVMKAFSVERILPDDERLPKTIIGYFGPNKDGNEVIKEWSLYVSEENHKKLVKEFRQYIKNR